MFGTKLLKFPEVLERLGVSLNTLKDYIATKGLPVVELGPKTKRVREDDLERWIGGRTKTAPAA